MGSSQNQGLLRSPHIVRHPYKKDPKRDPALENYPFYLGVICENGAVGSSRLIMIWDTVVCVGFRISTPTHNVEARLPKRRQLQISPAKRVLFNITAQMDAKRSKTLIKPQTLNP